MAAVTSVNAAMKMTGQSEMTIIDWLEDRGYKTSRIAGREFIQNRHLKQFVKEGQSTWHNRKKVFHNGEGRERRAS